MTAHSDGYWCEAVAHSHGCGRGWMLSGHLAHSPRLAMRWLRGQADRLANALDPVPGVGPLPASCLRQVDETSFTAATGSFFREWRADDRHQEVQLSALTSGRCVSVSSAVLDTPFGAADAEVLFCLSARPLPADGLQGLQGLQGL